MRRFFIKQQACHGQTIILQGEQAHHISHVLRMSAGDDLTFVDELGQVYHCQLTSFDKDQVTAQIITQTQGAQETQIQVTLYQGMPKGDKLETIIQKCTELGIARVVPVLTKRSVVKLDGDKSAKKTQRWQKIAQEASQQSKRLTVPEVSMPISFTQLLDEVSKDDLTIVLWEDETAQGLKALMERECPSHQVNLIVGPEGGLEADEVEALKEKGAYSATLGKRILRTETAGMAALTMVLYHTGDLG